MREITPLLLVSIIIFAIVSDGAAETYYVRQTVGNDNNDGLSPVTAWQHFSKLSRAMKAGDTAYVGPGLYREGVDVQNSGTAEQRIVFIADPKGEHTGDPRGVVMITGADPVDESTFKPLSVPGVYTASFPDYVVWGVVEMEGDQFRYNRVSQTKEYLVDKIPGADVVAKFPASFYYDETSKVLYMHTSDGKPPSSHEIEIIRRGNGIGMTGKHFVTVQGFTFRHFQDAGVNFFKGSSNGIAIGNTTYGSRQGVRVYTATNITVQGNTWFRNENCGVYFAAESTGGKAISNIAYENIKGIRWGSKSTQGRATDNTLFDNLERGLSIEDTDDTVLRQNRMVNNKVSQLFVLQGKYDSDENCFSNGEPEQLAADFYPFPVDGRYKTLADYQQKQQNDLHSRDGGCGSLPTKLDVHKLHEESMTYVERARKILNTSVQIHDEGTANGR